MRTVELVLSCRAVSHAVTPEQAVREGESSGQEVFSARPRLEPARPDCAVRGENSSQEKLNYPPSGPPALH